MSTPATRFSYFILLMRPKRYGGNREMLGETSILNGGDGSLLMNLGSLATVGWTKPANLILIVWDNGSYATTGGQDTATAHGADLAAAAIAMGIRQSVTVRTESDLLDAFTRARTVDGPWMIAAKVEESPPTAKPPLDCVLIKHRFMASQS